VCHSPGSTVFDRHPPRLSLDFVVFGVLPGGIYRSGQALDRLRASGRRGSQQLRHADQVIGRRTEGERHRHTRRAAKRDLR